MFEIKTSLPNCACCCDKLQMTRLGEQCHSKAKEDASFFPIAYTYLGISRIFIHKMHSTDVKTCSIQKTRYPLHGQERIPLVG